MHLCTTGAMVTSPRGVYLDVRRAGWTLPGQGGGQRESQRVNTCAHLLWILNNNNFSVAGKARIFPAGWLFHLGVASSPYHITSLRVAQAPAGIQVGLNSSHPTPGVMHVYVLWRPWT